MRYDLNNGTASYIAAHENGNTIKDAVTIRLIPGETDTSESWFKIGGADAMADALIAKGKIKPCILTTAAVDTPLTLDAGDYHTWAERRKALEKILIGTFK